MEMLESIVLFSIKSALVLTVLWLPYALLLRREKFFRFNRIVLLTILLLSLVIPLLNVTVLRFETASRGIVEIGMPQAWVEVQERFRNAFLLPEVVVSSQRADMPLWWFPRWQVLLSLLYIIGVAVSMFLAVRKFVRMIRFIPSACLWTDRQGSATIYCHAASVVPFSWMRSIVISESDYEQNGRTILLHEQAHVRLHHSYDVLLVQFMKIMQWFNPCIYLLEMDLRDVHEFQADDAVLSSGITAHSYQLLLIKKAVGSSSYTFANSFNHSLLKKRITMMLQKKSSPWRMARAIYLAPCAVLLALLLATPQLSSCKQDGGKVSENSENNSENPEGISVSASSDTLQSPVTKQQIQVKGKDGETTTLNVLSVAGVDESSDEAKKESDDRIRTEPAQARVADENYGGETVYDMVEELPAYPGGMEELMKFLQTQVKYPKEAEEKGLQGRVLVTFVVEKNGSISNAKVVKSVSPELDAEALHVVNMMPRWTPGKQRGEAVRVKFTIPILFRLK